MPSDWVAGAERIACTKTGGTYDGTPYCLVLHTTEADPDTVNACRRMAETHASPPQMWYSPKLDWFGQGIPLSRSGYALAHPGGVPETNKAGALQVEMFGFAGDTPNWPGEWLDNIGRRVLGGVLAAGYPIDTTMIAPTTGSDGYGRNGAVRMSWDVWRTFPGVCCHSNVPGNDHWDAGNIDLDRIVRAATGAGPGPTQEDDDLPLHIVQGSSSGEWWLTDWITKRHIHTPDQAAQIVVSTVKTGGKIEQHNNGPVVYDQATVDAVPRCDT